MCLIRTHTNPSWKWSFLQLSKLLSVCISNIFVVALNSANANNGIRVYSDYRNHIAYGAFSVTIAIIM